MTTKHTFRVLPFACLALTAACTKGTDITAEAPRPAVATRGGPSATPPDMPPPQPEARPAHPPAHDDPTGDFHLAAVVYPRSGGSGVDVLVDFGDRLVVLDDLPVGHALGDGPIVASRALSRGLPKSKTHSMVVHGAGGGPAGNWLVYGHEATRGSAPDGVAYRFDGTAWQRSARYQFSDGNGMPWVAGMFGWNDSGAVVVEQHMVSKGKGEDDFGYAATVHWFDAAKRSASKPIAMNLVQAAGAPDGHVWLVGTRDEKEGLWSGHVEPGGKTTWELLPGTETCGATVSTHGLAAREGGAVAVQLEYGAGDCPNLVGVHGFVHDATGWHHTGVRPRGSELLAYDAQRRAWSSERGLLVARGPGGEIVARERLPSVKRRDPANDDSPLDEAVDTQVYGPDGNPSSNVDGCEGARLLVRENGDRWLTRSCDVGDARVTAIFRERVRQPVVVIASEPEEAR